ncbi:MAG: SH3 domain-containing protein [Solidesulfovibrio sp.]
MKRNGNTLRRFFFLFLLPVLALANTHAWAMQFCGPRFAPEQSHIVVDAGNNLRQWGGKDYASAPIVKVLDALEEVQVLRSDGKWAEVETVDGKKGFVNAKCLTPYAVFISGKSPAGGEPLITCKEDASGTRKEIKADLDGDGRLETLRLTCQAGWGCANYFLDVYGPDGKLLFRGPRHGDSPLIFCRCHAGIYFPDIVRDIDGDGRAELLLPQPRSDVSPVPFEMFRWNGSGFTTIMTNVGLFADKDHPEVFLPVAYKDDADPFRYIYYFDEKERNRLVAGITGKDGKFGEAVVRFDGTAFRVVQWKLPYKKSESN